MNTPENAAPPLLRMEKTGVVFPSGRAALHNITAHIDEGEFVSIVGPSGCGKSTLLRMVAGLLPVTSGALHWPGPQGQPDNPGFVFQEPTLMPWATVFDNVYLPLRLQGQTRAQAHDSVETALARVDLLERQHDYPRALSGGMQMRVSIARALVTRSPMLLMDEPFAALDALTRERLDDDLLHLWQTLRWTVLFVTHSVYEAAYLSQRVFVLSEGPGRLIADIHLDNPHPRTATFRESDAFFSACQTISRALHQGA